MKKIIVSLIILFALNMCVVVNIKDSTNTGVRVNLGREDSPSEMRVDDLVNIREKDTVKLDSIK